MTCSDREPAVPFEDLTGTVVRKICMACSREYSGAEGCCPTDGNLLVPLPQDPYLGRKLGAHYQIKSVLGTGGMGVVYLAYHELMDREVAIKMLRAQFLNDTMSVKRFQQEAKAASRLKHPNVVTTYDFGVTANGQPYMVMDRLKGRSLAQEIKDKGQLSVERCIHIFSQACDALDHAHRQGVIHRDLKPGNIMLEEVEDDPDFVKVVDFGVAKLIPINNVSEESQSLTQAGEVCGSPVYMSPEQCLGQSLDARADIYSMGVVLYETLTGKLPLIGKNMVETMSKHLNETPPPFQQVRPDLYIPERVEQVVMRALSKDPYQRPQTMAELAQDLQFSIPRPGQSLQLRTVASPLPTASGAGKSWLFPALLAVLVAFVVGGLVFTWMYAHRPLPTRTVLTPAPAPGQPAVHLQAAPAQSALPGGQPPQAITTPQTVTPPQSSATVNNPEQPATRLPPTQAAPPRATKPDSLPVSPASRTRVVNHLPRHPRSPGAVVHAPRPSIPAVDPFAELAKKKSYTND